MMPVPTLLRCAMPCLLLAACAAPEAPSSQVPFGATARAAFARQAISLPSAAPVTGLDGAAALQAQQGYRKSFAEREPALRPLILGVGAQK
ncbi:MAG: hypothetical protein K2X55_20010 [Burkholderiaceae bacterium]|nr:hypothetical protein [Burkholderiaceae bacterium]